MKNIHLAIIAFIGLVINLFTLEDPNISILFATGIVMVRIQDLNDDLIKVYDKLKK